MKKLQPKFLLLLLLLGMGAIIATPLFVVADSHDSEDDEDSTNAVSDETNSGDDDDDDDFSAAENQEEDDAYERDLDIVVKADRIEIESTLKFGENKDEIEIEFRAESGEEPELELEYSTETDTIESEFGFEVEFEQIIEYIENGTTVGYQEGEEVSFYEIGETDWNDIVHTTLDVDGSVVNIFTATTTDGVFTIILRISGSLTELDGAILTPNSIKFDVEIHNFPYSSSDSNLAIKTKIETEAESEQKDESTEETIGLGSDEAEVLIGNPLAQGFFSWAENALADGLNISVISSPLDPSDDPDDDLEPGETSGTMFFSFNATDVQDIVWDPKVGVQSQGTQLQLDAISEKYSELRVTSTSTDSGLPGFEFWLILFSLGAVQVLRLRRFDR